MTHTTISAITNGAMTMRAPRFFTTTFILASLGAELNIIPTRSDIYRSTSQKWLGVLLAAADFCVLVGTCERSWNGPCSSQLRQQSHDEKSCLSRDEEDAPEITGNMNGTRERSS